MKNTIGIIGGGRVGSFISFHLLNDFNVRVFDKDEKHLKRVIERGGRFIKCDVSSSSDIFKEYFDVDLFVNCLPGSIGFYVLDKLIEVGKPIVDISFFNENPYILENKAKIFQIPVLVDCGIAPGFSNMILGYYNERYEVTDFLVYVGGLPINPVPPFYHIYAFSPEDLIDEYLRPARIIKNGTIVCKDPLEEIEEVNIEPIGKLESFYTDGLRTLLVSFPNMVSMEEKTLRFKYHLDFIKSIIRDTSSAREIQQKLNNLLYDKHTLEVSSSNPDQTVMIAFVKGKNINKKITLYDKYDSVGDFSSMARTTGIVALACIYLLMENKVNSSGIISPEVIGATSDNFYFVINLLKKFGVKIEISDM